MRVGWLLGKQETSIIGGCPPATWHHLEYYIAGVAILGQNTMRDNTPSPLSHLSLPNAMKTMPPSPSPVSRRLPVNVCSAVQRNLRSRRHGNQHNILRGHGRGSTHSSPFRFPVRERVQAGLGGGLGGGAGDSSRDAWVMAVVGRSNRAIVVGMKKVVMPRCVCDFVGNAR